MVKPFHSSREAPLPKGGTLPLWTRGVRRGGTLTLCLRYQNVRADVLDILQKSLRDGEVVGLNGPRSRFVRQGFGSESPATF